jgi:hypothetical protein
LDDVNTLIGDAVLFGLLREAMKMEEGAELAIGLTVVLKSFWRGKRLLYAGGGS